MRVLRYTVANVAPDATAPAKAADRFREFCRRHLLLDEAKAHLSTWQFGKAAVVGAIATASSADAPGFEIDSRPHTAATVLAALPAKKDALVSYTTSPGWGPANDVLALLSGLTSLPSAAFQRASFTLALNEAPWKVAPALSAFISLESAKKAQAWIMCAAADVVGPSSRDAAVKEAIAALSAKTGLPFADKRPQPFDLLPTEDVKRTSDAVARLDAAFEALRPRAQALASAKDLALVTTYENFLIQHSASPKPEVSFIGPFRAALVAALPRYAPVPDKRLSVERAVGDHAILAIEAERLSGLGTGRMFYLDVVVRFEGGSHDRVTWRQPLSRLWAPTDNLVHHYVTADDLARVLASLGSFLAAFLAAFEPLVPRD